MNDLKLSGQSDVKGRNGYAKLDRVSTFTVNEPSVQEIHIDFHSKNTNNVGCARLTLSYRDARALRAWFKALDVPRSDTEPHAKELKGQCEVCGHYGKDCTGA